MKQIIIALALTLSLQPLTALAKSQTIDLKVTEEGFVPSTADVKSGTNVTLKITRQTDATCATQVKIESKNITKKLPLNKPVTIALGKLDKGELRFGCGMDMIKGQIIVR